MFQHTLDGTNTSKMHFLPQSSQEINESDIFQSTMFIADLFLAILLTCIRGFRKHHKSDVFGILYVAGIVQFQRSFSTNKVDSSGN